MSAALAPTPPSRKDEHRLLLLTLAASFIAGALRLYEHVATATVPYRTGVSFILISIAVATAFTTIRPALALRVLDRLRGWRRASAAYAVALVIALLVAAFSAQLETLSFIGWPWFAFFASLRVADTVCPWVILERIEGSRRCWIAVITGTVAWAFALRFEALLLHPELELSGVSGYYLNAAWILLREHRYDGLAYPPGYTILAALCLGSGSGVPGLRIVEALIDSGAVALLPFLLGRLGVRPLIAWVGAYAYATSPILARGSITILAECVSPAAVVFILFALLWASDSCGSAGRWLWAGLLMGAAALVRPDMLVGAAVGPLWALERLGLRRAALRPAAMFVTGVGVLVGSWGLRNRVVHGTWIFTSTSGGNGLWEGLGEYPNSYGFVCNDEFAGKLVQRRGLTFHSIECDRMFRALWVDALKEHPWFIFECAAQRWQSILFDQPESDSRWWFTWLTAFAIVAVLLPPRRPERVLVILGPFVLALLSIGLVHYEPRYVRYVIVGDIAACAVIATEIVGSIAAINRPARLASSARQTTRGSDDLQAGARHTG